MIEYWKPATENEKRSGRKSLLAVASRVTAVEGDEAEPVRGTPTDAVVATTAVSAIAVQRFPRHALPKTFPKTHRR